MFVAGGSAGGRIGCVVSYHEGPDTNLCSSCTSASPSGVPYTDWNRSGVIALGDLWGSPEPVMRWYSLDSQDVPTCIIHGTADTTIPYQNSLDLYQGLTNVGVTVELHPIAGAGHTPSTDSRIEPWLANFFAQEWTKVLSPAPTVTAPTVAVQPATGVTASSATLNASVNPNGGATSCYFKYGQTTGYGSYSATNTLPAGTSPVAVNSALTGLLPGTLYHYQLVANNSAGSGSGSDATFTTPPAAPVAATQPVTGVTPGGATLNASVNPGGAATTWYFEYGPTTGHGSYTATNTLPAGTSTVAVNAPLTDLASGTPYHYQLVASNVAGSHTGGDALFTTVTVPPPQLAAPTVLGDGTVQFVFTSTPGASFTVLGTADPALPLSGWTVLGPVAEIAPGEYQFIDLQATNNALQFYLLRQR
jgi:hypothetical protein